MREFVERLFDKRLRERVMRLKENSRDELLKAAYEHPNRSNCIDNVVHQLRLLKLQRQMTKKNFVDITFTCADMYLNAVLQHLKERILTAAEKNRLIDEANKEKRWAEEFEADQKEALDTRIISLPGRAARSNA